MPISLQCPKCARTYTVPDEVSGRSVRCKHCGQTFVASHTLDGNQAETRKSRPAGQPGEPFPSLPAEFGRYRVLRLLGRGGMGSVYLAQDSHLGRRVALKLPSFGPGESPQRVERFVREARSAAVLQHPNICTVFDAGELDGRPFLTMAFIEGKPLEDAIDPESPMPQEEAARIAQKVALALGHAHGKGIVHRDLKPANVMLDAEGEPFVMDFGLAKRVSEADANETKLTHQGTVLGTPSYMAPEQVRSEADQIGPATDVYALGVMLFQMLTGRTPYGGPIGVVMAQILAAPVPPVSEFRPDVDARLNEACRRAMAKNPADRFPSMGAFAKALGEFLKAPEAATVAVVNVVPVLPMPLPPAEPNSSPFGGLSEEATILPTGRRRSPEPEQEETPTRSTRNRKAPEAGGQKLVLIGAGVVGLLVLVAVLVIVLRPKQAEVPAEPKGEVAGITPKKQSGPAPKTNLPTNTSFFNGKDLTGWVGLVSTWRVVDGAIVGKLPDGWVWSTFLTTQRDYKDFELKFRVWLKYGVGSSGLQIRSKLTNAIDYIVTGPKINIAADSLRGLYSEGTGLGWMKPPGGDVKRIFKANEFNAYTVRVVGKRVTVILNGETILDDVFPNMDDSGIIAFKLSGTEKAEEVTFKDIEFRELPGGG